MTNNRLSFLMLLFVAAITANAQKASYLLTEMRANPLGIDAEKPRLSWRISANRNEVMQTSYRILVASSPELLDENTGDLWDSGTVESDQSNLVAYGGKALKPNQRAWWKVRVNTTVGQGDWSETATWSRGLGTDNWQGCWIGHDGLFKGETQGNRPRMAARYLRRTFAVKKQVRQAMLYISGQGIHEAYINGKRVGEDVFTPIPSGNGDVTGYNAYDVTKMLTVSETKKDNNCIGVTLGCGIEAEKAKNGGGNGFPKLLANLIITYTNGETETVATTTDWKLSVDGPIRSNNANDGEIYDARMEFSSAKNIVKTVSRKLNQVENTLWATVDFGDSDWMPASQVEAPQGSLKGNIAEPVTPIPFKKHPFHRDELVQKLTESIFDMGQTFAGWVEINVEGKAAKGDTIRIRYANSLKGGGNSLDRDGMRASENTDYYICNGKDKGVWSPRFVARKFRFVEITVLHSTEPEQKSLLQKMSKDKEYSGRWDATEVNGVVVAAVAEPISEFACSDGRLNAEVWNNRWTRKVSEDKTLKHCFGDLAGIKPTSADYKTFNVVPPYGTKEISQCGAVLDTPYGVIEVEWQRQGEKTNLLIGVPCNTKAVLTYPDGNTEEFGSGRYTMKL